MSDQSNFGQYNLYEHNLLDYMRLDASALRALNLMPGPNDGANKTMSLFGLLNKCKTALGTRLLAQWLKQPLLDLSAIEERQTLVEAFALDTEVRQNLQVFTLLEPLLISRRITSVQFLIFPVWRNDFSDKWLH
jgi:DNA mismatch repair protein MSH2